MGAGCLTTTLCVRTGRHRGDPGGTPLVRQRNVSLRENFSRSQFMLNIRAEISHGFGSGKQLV